MKEFNVKISVINPDYNAQYEKEYGFLERQYENPKYGHEISWGINDLKEYRYKDNITMPMYYSHKEENVY